MNSERQKKFIRKELSYKNFKKRNNYLKDEKLIEFLTKTSKDKIPVHVHYENFICSSFIVPDKELSENDIGELLNWNNLDGWCAYGIGGFNGQYMISLPMEDVNIEILENAMPIIYSRHISDYKDILELNQIIEQVLELYEEEKGSYIALTNLGDLEKIVDINCEDSYCTFVDEYLKYYLFLSKSMIIRVFYAEFIDDIELGWNGKQNEEKYFNDELEIYYNLTTYRDFEVNCGYYRGFQVIRNDNASSKLIDVLNNVQEYLDFEVLDKSDEIIRVSCDPKRKDEFVQLQPVFFKNEVLVNYAHNSPKYRIEHNIIYCRGSWSLKYHINDFGEVYVYLKDLSNLPVEEQKHWQNNNIISDNGITIESIEREFGGNWSYSTKIEKLRNNLRNFPPVIKKGNEIYIWNMTSKLKEGQDISSIRYVQTDSLEEIKIKVDFLSQIIVEGFKEKQIKKLIHDSEGVEKSINSLEHLLKEQKIDEEIINKIIKPFRTLKSYRNIVNHRGNEYPDNFKDKTNQLVDDLSDSIDLLVCLIKEGSLIREVFHSEDSSDNFKSRVLKLIDKFKFTK